MASLATVPDLEILISTMNRNSLDFLLPMFPKHFSEYHILVVNQTSQDNLLVSEFANIRVINVFDVGLSRSRNIAITNSKAKISLLADDDVVYKNGFENAIIKAFAESDHKIITFNHQRTGLPSPQNKVLKSFFHDFRTIHEVCSIEIAFRANDIRNLELKFDENFGLGSHFETSEELLFLRTALKNNVAVSYQPFVIAEHDLISTGKNQGGDKQVFAWTALSYKIRGPITYLLLPKFLFYLTRNNFISKKEYFYKLKIGLSAIRKYKQFSKHKEK